MDSIRNSCDVFKHTFFYNFVVSILGSTNTLWAIWMWLRSGSWDLPQWGKILLLIFVVLFLNLNFMISMFNWYDLVAMMRWNLVYNISVLFLCFWNSKNLNFMISVFNWHGDIDTYEEVKYIFENVQMSNLVFSGENHCHGYSSRKVWPPATEIM